jgi:hypothetical protein
MESFLKAGKYLIGTLSMAWTWRRLQCEQRRKIQVRRPDLRRASCLSHDWVKSQFKHRICQLVGLVAPMISFGETIHATGAVNLNRNTAFHFPKQLQPMQRPLSAHFLQGLQMTPTRF